MSVPVAVRLAVLCAVLLLPGALPAAVKEEARRGNNYSQHAILGFTRHLIAKKEYYRAHAELMRLRSYYPGAVPAERAYATELFLLLYGGRYGELNRLSPPGDHTSRCVDAIFKSDSRLAAGEYGKALSVAVEGRGAPCTVDLAPLLGKRAFASALLAGSFESAERMAGEGLLTLPGEFEGSRYARLLASARRDHSMHKDPVCAAALGLVPGLGYAYAGNMPTGIIAFIAFSALGALAAGAYLTDNKPLAFFFGLGATLVYGGSALGGYRQALRYNEAYSRERRERLSRELDFDSDRQMILREYGIGDEP